MRYILVGSGAAAAHGVEVDVRDFDIVPETTPANLERVAAALEDLRARPHFDPAWPFSREECDAWRPVPATQENLDHLYETPHGLFDVVPWRAGRYDDLAGRAVVVDGVAVADVDDLITQLHLDKPKHRARLPQLEAVKETRGSKAPPR